ncbi:type II secretion system protein [Niveibacterium sp. SC-1]|uniref:type II secretion system protein n=1 Tax=Niveibacterium sp. SC-1 TaxID=3135646 RepID=UPI00311FBEC6
MRDRPESPQGFTLIELLVVLAIVAVLLTLSLPRYFQHAQLARERVLVENLHVTRDAIDKFYADRNRYPESLDELIELRYLRGIPVDPILERSDAWVLDEPPQGKKGRVFDLHSSAPGAAIDGRPFSGL